jgi:hypothetical protein
VAYSNGYDVTAVIAALKDRIGFRQPLGTGVPTLTTAVTTSNSGRYFQDFHSLVTVQNIKSTMEQPEAVDADLIIYLGQLRQSAIMRVLNGVFNSLDIIEQMQLFTRYGQNDQLITNTADFVGYEIDIADSPDAALQIDALQLLFDSAVTFNVYLFKDGFSTAIWTQSVTTTAGEIKVVTLTDKVLGRGKYYLGYFQDDIGAAKAYREQVADWNCTRMFRAQPVKAQATGATTFNRNERSYPAEPYGLNIEVSSFKDHTSQIVRKAAMFDELIGLQLAYMIIEQTVYSTRSNTDERILKDQIDRVGVQLDLNGAAPISDGPKVTGLKQRIERELATVRKAFYPSPKAQTVNLC